MSFKCQKTQRLLSDYIDATLSERQMKDVAEHLDSCRICKREAIDLKKTCHLLENFYVEPEVSDIYYAAFTKTLQQRIEQSAPTTLHQRVYETGTRLTWQLTARVRRYIDRCLPEGTHLHPTKDAALLHARRSDDGTSCRTFRFKIRPVR